MNPDPLSTEEPGGLPPDVLALALLKLRADGDHEAADALAAESGGAVGKSMSAAVGSAGGFLVPPAAGRRRRKRKARRVVKALLREIEGGLTP